MSEVLGSKKDYIVNFLKALFCGLCLSLVLVLIFAFLLKFVDFSDNAIKVVNQVIKISSIFYSVFMLTKKDKHSVFFKSIFIGFLYAVCAYLIFSLLSGVFKFDITNFNDMVFNAVVGAVIGLFMALIHKPKTA